MLEASPALRFRPATRVENACATGTAAVQAGLRAIEAKAARLVLVVGVEKMTALSGPEIAGPCSKRATPGRRRRSRAASPASSHGSRNSISNATATSRTRWPQSPRKTIHNGVANPYAQIRKDLGFEFCRHVSERTRWSPDRYAPTAPWCRMVLRRWSWPMRQRAGDGQGGRFPCRSAGRTTFCR